MFPKDKKRISEEYSRTDDGREDKEQEKDSRSKKTGVGAEPAGAGDKKRADQAAVGQQTEGLEKGDKTGTEFWHYSYFTSGLQQCARNGRSGRL